MRLGVTAITGAGTYVDFKEKLLAAFCLMVVKPIPAIP
jgi:hypothetical protein